MHILHSKTKKNASPYGNPIDKNSHNFHAIFESRGISIDIEFDKAFDVEDE